MEGKRLLRSMTLKNILSFGPEGQTLDFEPLIMLIGANGLGKSNLIEIIGLMRALPKDLGVPLREGGGMTEWFWKGNDPFRSIIIDYTLGSGDAPDFRHQIALEWHGNNVQILAEKVNNNLNEFDTTIVFDPDGRFSTANSAEASDRVYLENFHIQKLYKSGQSLLAQQSSVAELSRVIFPLAEILSSIQLFRKWVFGPGSKIRDPQKADLPSDFLAEGTLNLGLVLNSLILDRRAKFSLLKNIKDIIYWSY